MNVILESLLKWFAPILVFTTEEIYSLVNKDKNESIHENNFVKIPASWENTKLNEKWTNLFKIKQEANIAIEEKRASKEIGSSLEAEIKLILKKEKFELLDKLDKISFSLIIGGAIGNFYDRMIFKAVPDFIDLHYKNFHWFTFNVADILISLGIIIFLIKGLLESKIK